MGEEGARSRVVGGSVLMTLAPSRKAAHTFSAHKLTDGCFPTSYPPVAVLCIRIGVSNKYDGVRADFVRVFFEVRLSGGRSATTGGSRGDGPNGDLPPVQWLSHANSQLSPETKGL
jgi:hypothetical protein